MRNLLFILVLVTETCWAASNHYIRQGASGANNGTSWTDAWTGLPETLVRGDTYYVADGDYDGAVKFVYVATSGTNLIRIVKAATNDTAVTTIAGWSDNYGDGQAVLPRFWLGTGTGYIEFDGKYAYGLRWNVPSQPGASGGTAAFHIRNDERTGGVPNLTWKYCEILGPAVGSVNHPYATDDCPRGIRGWEMYGTGYDNYLISHCSIQGLIDPIYLSGADNVTVEYCELAWASSGNGENHGDIFYMRGPAANGVFRYNTMHDFNAEGVLLSTSATGWEFYGNLCYRGNSGHTGYPAFIETHDALPNAYSGFKIYNNTIVDCVGKGLFLRTDVNNSGHVATNNLIYNSAYAFGGAVHDYNWYSGLSKNGETNGIAGGTANPFIDKPSHDYRLISGASAIDKGATLDDAYAYDLDGYDRRTNGAAWDIGAYEAVTNTYKFPVITTIENVGNATFKAVTWTCIEPPTQDFVIEYGTTATTNAAFSYSRSFVSKARTGTVQVKLGPVPWRFRVTARDVEGTTYSSAIVTNDVKVAGFLPLPFK